jgi:Domain of unknown function (DUF4375)
VGALTARDIAGATDDELPAIVFHAIADGDDEPPVPQQHVYFVELLNYEIGCGGLLQYFHNTRGAHVEQTEEALQAMGAATHLAAFRVAVERWTEERPSLEEQWRPGTVEAIFGSYEGSRLPALDDSWYEAPIEPIEAAYIRDNVDSFVRPA